jgi:hypothetical protein
VRLARLRQALRRQGAESWLRQPEVLSKQGRQLVLPRWFLRAWPREERVWLQVVQRLPEVWPVV